MKRVNILSASAGSGKTYRLVLKYICDIIERPDRYRNILAVTFTNKATEEMKSRIINEINVLASNKPSQYLDNIMAATSLGEQHIRAMALKARTKILHDYSHFTILTIDRFFQRILRAFINELSLDLNYNIELDTSMLLERSADSLIENIAKDEDLKNWLLEFAEERIEDGSKWDMRGDLCSLGSELFKEGAAKRVKETIDKKKLHSIINDLVANNRRIKNKVKELGEYAEKYLKERGISKDSFKGGSRSFVYAFEHYAKGELKAPTATMIHASEHPEAWCGKKPDPIIVTAADNLAPVLKEICDLYADNIKKMNTTKLLKENYRSFALLSNLYESLTDICDAENIMVLDKTKEILSEFIDTSNAPFIYEKVGNRYDHYMIDEFQDTSIREWRNLKPLLLEALASNPEASVFIVGDIKQSIYRWRGGDWRLLNGGVVNDLGAENTHIESLDLNYRSLKNVVDFNKDLINSIVETDNKYLNSVIAKALSNNKISQSTHASLCDMMKKAYVDNKQKAAINSDNGGVAEVCLYDSGATASPFIQTIEDAISRGYRYRDILILVRGTNDGSKVASALYEYKLQSNKRFNILTSDSLTIESCDIVSFIIAVLRLSIDAQNDIERGIYNQYMHLPYHQQFGDDELQLFRYIAHLSPVEAFEMIVEKYSLNAKTQHIAYLQAMHEQIIAFSSNHTSDIQHYLEWWEERGKNETLSVEMDDNTIEITTIHKAKGLERDVVIIPYCKWSLTPPATHRPIVWANANSANDIAEIGDFPVVYGNTMENSAFAEEYYNELVMSHIDGINLLYVAVTRAAKELYMYLPCPKSQYKEGDNISNITTLLANAAGELYPDTKQADGADDGVCRRHSYGCKIERHIPKDKCANEGDFILKEYITHTPEVSIHYPSKRYSDEGLVAGTDARNNGIVLHRMFERAVTKDDLYKAIRKMERDRDIDEAKVQELCKCIDKAMGNNIISEWFEPKWDDVRTEAEIITKDSVRRPDRVMISGDRVVVVDYKFGDKKSKYYNKQMKEYLSLVDAMGCYKQIEGYVWYISLGEVEHVVMK